MKALVSIGLLVGIVSIFACNTDDGGSKSTADDPAAVKIDYVSSVKQIIDTSCISCHDSAVLSGGVDLSTYENVKLNGDKVVEKVSNGTMPPPVADDPKTNLSQNIKDLFVDWKTNSYPEGAGTAKTGVTYADDIKPIMEGNCTSCHVAGGEREATDFTDADIVSALQGTIVEKVMDGTMPPEPKTPLTLGQKVKFELWQLQTAE